MLGFFSLQMVGWSPSSQLIGGGVNSPTVYLERDLVSNSSEICECFFWRSRRQLCAFDWPNKAVKELASGTLLEDAKNVPVSRR